jgi:ribosomal protein S18 acetylase RimI-like enzyme
MSNPFKEYLVQKCGYDEPIELDGGFLLYAINGNECHIGEIYVPKERRQSKIASKMADMATEIAKNKGCTHLTARTNLVGSDDEAAILSILHYGFKVIRADQNSILFMKEII